MYISYIINFYNGKPRHRFDKFFPCLRECSMAEYPIRLRVTITISGT